MKSEAEGKLLDLCVKHLEPQGFRAVDVDCHVASRSLVRVFIERLSSDTASIDDCSEVSRILGPIIEADELVPGAYDLEVSSPGLDRRLRLPSDFEKVVGEEVKLKLVERIESLGANLTGKLVRVDGDVITLSTQGKEVPVPLSQIKRASRVFHFEKKRPGK